MHHIAPYIKWRNKYISEEDERSPFYLRTYNFELLSKKIYNYFIHPGWDEFGSSTLYAKVLYADYEEKYCIIELLGEWNDCLYNDIMYLKREVVDFLNKNGLVTFIIVCDNVLNFHSSDDSYYEEWWDDVKEENGNIIFLNTRKHVWEEMEKSSIQYYASFGELYNDFEWRNKPAKLVYMEVMELLQNATKQLA